VQHIYVERVALNPFPTVEEPSQQTHGGVDFDAESTLDRLHRAHLIGDRTNPADARHEVGNFREVPAAKKGLEESGRFVDLQLYVLNLIPFEFDEKGPFSLDAGQCFNLDCS
jgi:hypothetical protein